MEVQRTPIITLKGAEQYASRQGVRFMFGESVTEQLSNLSMSTPPSTPSTPLTTEEYNIVAVTESDIDRVVLFLRKFFFRDEPLNIALELLNGPDETCQELEAFSIEFLKENLSLMAVSASGQIVGVSVNAVTLPNKAEDDSHECPNKKFAKILRLLYTVDKQADVFSKFPGVDKFIDVKILSVDGAWRGRGIAKALMDRTREMARNKGFTMMRVDCTSHYSARAIARLGFQCVYTMSYADYLVDDIQVFKPEPPHNEVKIYVQKIDN